MITTNCAYMSMAAFCAGCQQHPAAIELLDENYLQKDSSLFVTLNGLQGSEQKEQFLREHLDDLLLFMKKRFTSKGEDQEERSQQTAISRAHTSFRQHNGAVVCDFQISIPKKYHPDGINGAAFDMVTFSVDEAGRGVFTFVQLKCNKAACEGDSGLGSVHIRASIIRAKWTKAKKITSSLS